MMAQIIGVGNCSLIIDVYFLVMLAEIVTIV